LKRLHESFGPFYKCVFDGQKWSVNGLIGPFAKSRSRFKNEKITNTKFKKRDLPAAVVLMARTNERTTKMRQIILFAF
jgi:hypothetical protein